MAANVKRLTDYKAKIVLCPQKAGKIKNGIIPDSNVANQKSIPKDVDKLKITHQNQDGSVFALPAVKKRCKAAKIDKAAHSLQVYKKLR